MLSHLPENGDSLHQLREILRQDSRDSFQVLKNYRENPICSISLDEPSRFATVVWKQYATQPQLRFIHESMLALIREHRICRILGDDTALPTIPSEDQVWLVESWMPRAVASGLRFVASKRPESYFGKLSITHIQSSVPPGLVFRAFEKLHEAREWLFTATAC